MRKGKIVLPLAFFLILVTAGTGIWVYSSGRKLGQEAVGTPIEPSSGKENQVPVPSSQTAQNFFLELLSPEDGITTKIAQVTVRGRTTPGSEVFVNNEQVYPDKNGDFQKEITLEEGENYVFVTAGNGERDSEFERIVYFEKG